MIDVNDYISGIYVNFIISQEEYESLTNNKCYFDRGLNIYEFGIFYDSKDYYHVNKLGNPEFLKKKLREIRLSKVLK